MNLPSPELSGEPALLTGYELGFREMGVQFYTELCENSAALNTSCPGSSWEESYFSSEFWKQAQQFQEQTNQRCDQQLLNQYKSL